jgi:hypothetical protein
VAPVVAPVVAPSVVESELVALVSVAAESEDPSSPPQAAHKANERMSIARGVRMVAYVPQVPPREKAQRL